MKKLFLVLMLFVPMILMAQSHNLNRDFYGGTVYKDSLRFVADSTHSPIQDSVHIFNFGLTYDYGILVVLLSADNDSMKVSNGVIGYNRFGVAADTTWTDEVIMRDSSWSVVSRAISTTSTNKAYTIFPVGQLLKFELVNYRAAVPTRVLNYRFIAYKKSR